ncbi:hypothetical protein GCM10023115_23710 [Pontixanthobacter gangjinensis]|uniref:DUF4255 domain-containing protein n=1 Tax=Pontixanthobacter gangjinensis TaxID=1028742 RepID=A0A6I4SRS7_9SPHN|nr:Pvc16 family protein [Pontixanthobacter gangjinensis]MXO57617.1 DUF4255 domain-containing protein [Pontixanthobacter gangjinensis]
MIAETLGFLAEHLNRELRRESGSDLQSVYLATPPTAEQPEGLYLSLVQLQREASISNMAAPVRGGGPRAPAQPSLHLKLMIMVSAHYQDYTKSLAALEGAIAQFTAHPRMSRETSSDLPSGLDRLSFEWQDLAVTEMSALWSSLGRDQVPCALYLVRGLEVGQGSIDSMIPTIRSAEPE